MHTATPLVANLHRPVSPGSDPAPLVVVTGSWTTSKEQQADFYARRLADRGVTTLTFDFRGFGQSQGEPRDWENPERKAADIVSAVDFAQTLPGIDPARIGGLGVCASSGYQAVAVAQDDRIRSLAMIAPWLHNTELVAPYYGGAEGVAERIEASQRAAARFAETGEVESVPAISETDPAAAMYGPYDYYLDPERGAVPEWDARLATMSWEPWLRFDPISVADRVSIPVQMVHSRDGAVPDGAQAFFDGLPGPKDLTWLSGGQLDFYDQPQQVEPALELVLAHYGETL